VGGALRRSIGFMAFLPIASRVPTYARLVFELAMDERMPGSRKALLGGALGYIVLGRDLIPDTIPLIGGLDDLVIVALAVDVFLDGVPDSLLNEKLGQLGIDRRSFDDDVAQIRRLTPGPVRRTIRRIPTALAAIGETVTRSGVGPRVRDWINKEGSIA
jgi:uncharacterized membrane protein YkvA (DUF1232 family)